MLQDRNTNVKVDAWIKQFNEEQKVQDQRIANLEETEKTVQNATCFDGCTSAHWKDYIANNPATDITADNFSVHNDTSEIKMGSNVELKSGSSKVEVDDSSVTNETQFTNQFSEVSKAKTEIYSGDDSTHFEAKAECGPEGKSSCIRVSADYSLLNTSTSNTDFGNYYFSNQKAEFTFPNHCFEFCCDGLFLIDGQPSTANNAICFDGCDATCWRDYIDSKASSASSIMSPDGCALITTTCDGNKICLCDQTFTFGYCCDYNAVCFVTNCNLCIGSCRNSFYSACNFFSAYTLMCSQNKFCAYSRSGCIASNVFEASGGCGINCFYSDYCNYFYSNINCLCSTSCNEICSFQNYITARRSSGLVKNTIFAYSENGSAYNCFVAKTENYLSANVSNKIVSGNHQWVFCCDGRFLVDGHEFSVGNAACFDGCDAACWRAYINNNIHSCICLGTRKVALTTDGLCVNDGRLCFEYKCCSQGGSYYDCYATLSLYDDPPSDGASFLRIQNTNGLSRNFIELVASNAIYLCGDVRICRGNHCWEFCCDGNLYKDGVCVL